MSYKEEILAFKPTYDAIMQFMAGRKKFYLPLNQQEVDVAIRFAGLYYDGRGLTPEQCAELKLADGLFRTMQGRCPEIHACDLTDQEYPFTVKMPIKEQWKTIETSPSE